MDDSYIEKIWLAGLAIISEGRRLERLGEDLPSHWL